MRQNQSIHILGSKVLLVPYKAHHVPKYHKWMQSEELQTLTASEPLSLEAEYQMQQSWLVDENKCTFIVLNSKVYEESKENEIDAMIGDVNLFFNEEDEPRSAEIEIMIAESSARGSGCGKESCLAMMKYGVDELNINRYTAKIGYANEKSLNMFKKFGFQEISRSDVFEEVTLEFPITESSLSLLNEQTLHISIKNIDQSLK